MHKPWSKCCKLSQSYKKQLSYFQPKHYTALPKEGHSNQLTGRVHKSLQRLLVSVDTRSLGLVDCEGLHVTSSCTTIQSITPPLMQFLSDQQLLISAEVESMLAKQEITPVQPSQGNFISQIVVVPKKDGGYRPVINLKALNRFVVEEHF